MQRYDITFYLAHNFTTKSLNLTKIIYLFIFNIGKLTILSLQAIIYPSTKLTEIKCTKYTK